MAKVLLVDYAPRSIERIRSVLGSSGYDVTVARDGDEGLQAVDTLRPDVVVLQDLIPRKHGFDVCREIKEDDRRKDVPVIILTSARGSRNNELIRSGCDGYLKKPFDDDALVNAIRGFAEPGASKPAAGAAPKQAPAASQKPAAAAAPKPSPAAAPVDDDDLDAALDAAFSMRREAV